MHGNASAWNGRYDCVRAVASPSRRVRGFSLFSPFMREGRWRGSRRLATAERRASSIGAWTTRPRPDFEYRFLEFRYEPERRRLVGPVGEARLKPLSDRLLRCLLDAPGAVLSREHLIETVWTRREVNDEVLSRAIAELRAVLGDDAREPRFVETLSKGGYRWIAPVARADVRSAGIAQASPFDRRGRLVAALGAVALIALGVWLLVQRGRDDAHDPAKLAVSLLGARPLAARSASRIRRTVRRARSRRLCAIGAGQCGERACADRFNESRRTRALEGLGVAA